MFTYDELNTILYVLSNFVSDEDKINDSLKPDIDRIKDKINKELKKADGE